MTYDLTSGLRNNFLAVIMFLITVILTDSMNWDDLINRGIPRDVVYVAYVFAGASFFYLVITLIGVKKKWNYCSDGYFQIKKNYEEVLEKNDLDRIFEEDRLIKNAKKQIRKDEIIVSILWIFFLVMMVAFFSWMKYSPLEEMTVLMA